LPEPVCAFLLRDCPSKAVFAGEGSKHVRTLRLRGCLSKALFAGGGFPALPAICWPGRGRPNEAFH
jgi:hypothetical protein